MVKWNMFVGCSFLGTEYIVNENEEKIFHFNILNMMMWIPDGVIKNSPLRLCPDALGYEVR